MIFTTTQLEKESLKIFNMFNNDLSDKVKNETKKEIVQYIKKFHKIGQEIEKQNKSGELAIFEALKEEMQIYLTLDNDQKVVEIYCIIIALFHLINENKNKLQSLSIEIREYLHNTVKKVDDYVK